MRTIFVGTCTSELALRGAPDGGARNQPGAAPADRQVVHLSVQPAGHSSQSHRYPADVDLRRQWCSLESGAERRGRPGSGGERQRARGGANLRGRLGIRRGGGSGDGELESDALPDVLLEGLLDPGLAATVQPTGVRVVEAESEMRI